MERSKVKALVLAAGGTWLEARAVWDVMVGHIGFVDIR